MKLGIKTISHPFSVKQHSFKEIEKEIGSEVRKRDRLKGEKDKSCKHIEKLRDELFYPKFLQKS